MNKTTEVAIKKTNTSALALARRMQASAFPGQTFKVQTIDATRFAIVLTDTDTAVFRG